MERAELNCHSDGNVSLCLTRHSGRCQVTQVSSVTCRAKSRSSHPFNTAKVLRCKGELMSSLNPVLSYRSKAHLTTNLLVFLLYSCISSPQSLHIRFFKYDVPIQTQMCILEQQASPREKTGQRYSWQHICCGTSFYGSPNFASYEAEQTHQRKVYNPRSVASSWKFTAVAPICQRQSSQCISLIF